MNKKILLFLLMLMPLMASAQTKRTIHVATAGTLPNLISENEKYQIDELTLSGELNGTDIELIRDMAGTKSFAQPYKENGSFVYYSSTEGKLKSLNISEVKIVKGGYGYIKVDDYGTGSCTEDCWDYLYTSNNTISHLMFYLTKLESIVIPNSVTSIASDAFSSCDCLTSIKVNNNNVYDSRNDCNAIIESSSNSLIAGCKNTIIPNSVNSIGNGAFSYCNGLTSITIPSNVTSIGWGAFQNCTGLTTIVSEIENPFAIDDDVFYCSDKDLYATATLIVPAGKMSVYQNTAGWSKFQKIVEVGGVGYEFESGGIYYRIGKNNTVSIVPKNPEYSGDVVIPESVEYDGKTYTVTTISFAFNGCSDLTSITIPPSITRITEDSFRDCTGLTSVHISDLVAWLNVRVDVGTRDGGIDCSSSPVYYAHHLYLNGEEIKSIDIPNTWTSIPDNYFEGWSGLTSVTIPNGVNSLGYMAFRGCSGLTSVNIPSSVTSIGWHAFQNCTGLTTIVSEIENPFEIDEDVFYSSDVDIYSTATLIVPFGKKTAYENTAGWRKFTNIIEDGGSIVSTKLSDGFYYFKNAATGRYISFNDTDPENYPISESGDVNMAGIRTYINYDTVSVSPSCVIFVKNLGNDQYDLTFQDSNLKGIISNISDIIITSVDNEKYTIHIIYNGITKYLCDGSASGKDSWLMNRLEETKYWIPIPVNTTDNYIGVRPDIKTASGEYWGTIYTGFNFKVASEGMTAYYVSNVEGTEFKLERINEDVIPAGNPVVIRCNSPNPQDNKIEPVVGDYSFTGNNKLGGVYCALSEVAKHFNATEYNPSTMRVLGLNDTGELSFVKANPENLYNDIYLRANKAYLNVNSTDAEVLSLVSNNKCAKPTISYYNGMISFSCETEGVEFHYTISNTNSSTGIGNSVNFSPTVNISVYASKTGFGNSDTSTAEIVVPSGLRGDLTGDGKVNVADHVELSNIILGQ